MKMIRGALLEHLSCKIRLEQRRLHGGLPVPEGALQESWGGGEGGEDFLEGQVVTEQEKIVLNCKRVGLDLISGRNSLL